MEKPEAKMTVLSLCDGRDSGIQTDREPTELDWFFDIYIQGSNTTFLELSLKFSRHRTASENFSYHNNFPRPLSSREEQIDQATKST